MATITLKQLSKDELVEAIEEWYDHEVIDQVNVWLERGDGVVVYENHDLGHHLIGHKILFSYGSETAQLPELPEAGKSCPVDLGRLGLMSYRYYPFGYYRGEKL